MNNEEPIEGEHSIPGVGRLGQDPLAFEKERLRKLKGGYQGPKTPDELVEHERSYREAAERELEGDEPRGNIIAQMASGRAGMRIARHAAGLPPVFSPGGTMSEEDAEQQERDARSTERSLIVHEDTRSVPQVFDDNAMAEMGLMVRAVVGELSRGLRQTFGDLKSDIEENTRLLGIMNAPMEAITDSHERASASFETLRSDILGGGLDKLEKVLDTAGLSEAQSRAEARIEVLITTLAAKVDAAFTAQSLNMVQILTLLERLQARELREAKRRATPEPQPPNRDGGRIS